MRRTAVLLALAAAPLAAQSTFEGAISMTVTGDNGNAKPFPMTYLMKDGKIRFDMQGRRNEQMAVIVDPATQKMLMLMISQKMYMENDLSKAVEQAKANAKGGDAKVEHTGKTETIAGYKCEHLIITESDGSKYDVCAASNLGVFRMPSGGGPMSSPKEPGWSGALGKDFFPLKVQKGDKVTLEVTKIEKKDLDAALFAAPDGFRKFDMGSMFKRP